MPPLRVLSEDSIQLLQMIADEFNRTGTLPTIPNRGTDPIDDGPQAPEVYVAKPVTTGGIPAMVGIVPGSATCNIYQFNGTSLIPCIGITRVVYNLSNADIEQEYIAIYRTKFGQWLAATGSSSSSVANEIWCGIASQDIEEGAIGLVYRISTGIDVPVYAELGSIVNGAKCYVSEIEGVDRIINSQCVGPGTGT